MSNRRKVLQIHGSLFPSLLCGLRDGYGFTTKDVPDDLTIVAARYDGFLNQLELVVASETFEETPEGEHYPPFMPNYTRVRI